VWGSGNSELLRTAPRGHGHHWCCSHSSSRLTPLRPGPGPQGAQGGVVSGAARTGPLGAADHGGGALPWAKGRCAVDPSASSLVGASGLHLHWLLLQLRSSTFEICPPGVPGEYSAGT